jgi:glycosyltransferase involved in cell wall biosynthesis
MKILIAHNHYQQLGGEHVYVAAQIALLQQHGHQVVLYSRDNSNIQDYSLAEKALFFPRTVFSRETYKQIVRLVRRERPDVAHIHNVFPLISPAVYRALNEAGVPIVQTVHNFRFLCPNSLFYTHDQICERCKHGNTLHAIRWQCYRDSYSLSALYALSIGLHRHWGTFQMIDRFIALSEFAAQKLVEGDLSTREKIVVLGNFLSAPLPRPGTAERREPYVVYIGRLSREKGARIAIEAMAGVPNLELKVLGTGPQAAELQELVRRCGLDNVMFLGYVAGEEKWHLLRHALATVVPSVCYENFPLAILDSLAVGTPAVASQLGSIPYIVRDGETGVLFHAGDSTDLRAKLAGLIDDPQRALAMGQRGRHFVEQQFSEAVHYRRLMAIYESVAR